MNIQNLEKTVWLVYDGECPICKPAANAFQIKQAVGKLEIIDKRTSNHPLLQELKDKGINLEKGMVLKMDGNIYQGADALHITALIGTRSGFFNRASALLFRSRRVTYLIYPYLRMVRKIALVIKRVPKIESGN